MRIKSKKSQREYGLLNSTHLKAAKYKLLYGIMYAIMIIIALVCLVPVIWVALSGFKETKEMYAIPPTFFPKSIDLSKIPEIISKVNFGKYIFNTFNLIIGCLAFDIFLNGIAGYVLSRVKPKGSVVLETLIFWSMMLPGISMVPLYMSFADVPILHVNLLGGYLPLWMMAGTNAFNIFLFRNFFNGISMSYIEAARLDGCSELSAFFRIILPLSKPIVAVVAIFSIIGSWGNFLWPYLVLDKGNRTISVLLYELTTGTTVLKNNELMLLLMLAAIPPIIVYIIFSRQINGGVDMSGIKG